MVIKSNKNILKEDKTNKKENINYTKIYKIINSHAKMNKQNSMKGK